MQQENEKTTSNNATTQPSIVNIHFFIRNLSIIHKKLLQPLWEFRNRSNNIKNLNNNFFYEIGNSDLDLQDEFMEIFQNLKDEISVAILDFIPLLNSTCNEIDYHTETIRHLIDQKSPDENTCILLYNKIDHFIDLKEKAILQLELLEIYAEDLDTLLKALHYNKEIVKEEEEDEEISEYDTQHEISDYFYRLLSDKCQKSHAEASQIISNKVTRTFIMKLSYILDASGQSPSENNIITTVLNGCIDKIQREEGERNLPIAIQVR